MGKKNADRLRRNNICRVQRFQIYTRRGASEILNKTSKNLDTTGDEFRLLARGDFNKKKISILLQYSFEYRNNVHVNTIPTVFIHISTELSRFANGLL